ncbi:MAG: right-handed parallel beta-helix repeat-containing protein, partial [Clostridia bacterium]|nr:right-handed parallel beta-helix repeat-containing protein [Clostridia bacterium]
SDTLIHVVGELHPDAIIRFVPLDPVYPTKVVTIGDAVDGLRPPVENFVSDRSNFAVNYENYDPQTIKAYNFGESQKSQSIQLEGGGFHAIQCGEERTGAFLALNSEVIQIKADHGKRIKSITAKDNAGNDITGNMLMYYRTYNSVSFRGGYITDGTAHIYADLEDCEYKYYQAKDATCTTAGHVEYYTLTTASGVEYYAHPRLVTPVDPATLITQEALGHDLVDHAGQSPTCTESGYAAYQTCNRCDYTTYQTLAALGHNYVDGTCTRCGKSVNEIDSWAELQACISSAANDTEISLRQNVTATASDTELIIPANKTLILDLNGKILDRNLKNADTIDQGSAIRLEQNANLTINDTSAGHTGKITGGNTLQNGGGICVGQGATLTLNNVTVSGNKASALSYATESGNGGGIYVGQNATAILNNVTVSGNTSAGNYRTSGLSGGVYVYNGGTVTMNGGTITGNTGKTGGVCLNGDSFTMNNNATITGNTGTDYIGGVEIRNGTFTMNGGGITDNNSGGSVGGVSVNKYTTFNINSGSVTGNFGTSTCGGVCNDGTLNVSGTVMINNNIWWSTIVSDVYSDSINITGALDSSSSIGIYPMTFLSTNPQVIVTSGFTGRATIDNFFSNDDEGALREVDGELAVCLLRNVTLSGSNYTATDYDGGVNSAGTSFTAVAGDTITLTSPENKKMALTSVKCGDDDVATTHVSYRSYTFVMPAGDVTVNASASDFPVDHLAYVAPTCIDPGNVEYWVIGSGDDTQYYNNATCLEEVTWADITIAPTGHNFGDDNKCTVCGREKGKISTWKELQDYLDSADQIIAAYLIDDIFADGTDTTLTIPAGKTVTIDLKDHSIDRNMSEAASDGTVITIGAGAQLSIANTGDDVYYGKITGGNATGDGGGIYVGQNAGLALYNVNVENNNSGHDGG